MVKVCFMRWKNRNRPYGYIAEMPLTLHQKNSFVDPFFIVQIDEKTIPSELLGDQTVGFELGKTVRLDLDKLQKRFPDSTEKYTDENDVEQERVVYGYFSEHGRSNDDNPPVITMSEVLYG